MSETMIVSAGEFQERLKGAKVDRLGMMFWWIPEQGPDLMTMAPSMNFDTKVPTAVVVIDNVVWQMSVTPHHRIEGLRSDPATIKQFQAAVGYAMNSLEQCKAEGELLHFGLRGARSSISYQRNGQPTWTYGVEENILLRFNFGYEENPDDDFLFIDHQGEGIGVSAVDEKLDGMLWNSLAYSLLPFAWKEITWERRCQTKCPPGNEVMK